MWREGRGELAGETRYIEDGEICDLDEVLKACNLLPPLAFDLSAWDLRFELVID